MSNRRTKISNETFLFQLSEISENTDAELREMLKNKLKKNYKPQAD